MSSIQALYVYSPAYFVITTAFDCYNPSETLTAGKHLLPAAVYRLPAEASVTPATGAEFELVKVQITKRADGTKNSEPEPPPRATANLQFGAPEALTFFGALGNESSF